MGDGWSIVTPMAGENALPGLRPGLVIAGRYEIIQLLGEGGMGAVFKAMDRQLDRIVALKVIRPELAGHPTVLRRFKQELLLARQVTHRNVIRIFDLGVADGLHFITMDFVQGRDLNALLEERKFTPEEAVKIIRQVADALDAAHSESVIHRDLKPHNIMLTEAGKVYVMDFGLARSVETSGITRTGALLGTPTYMSPEQAKGIAVDTRSDLFSLGVIFYEMLTGDVPFKAETVFAMLLKRTQEPPTPPIQVNPAIPAVLSDVVMKCLAIDPVDRYQTAAELSQDLRAFEEQTDGVRLQTSMVIKSRSLTPSGIVTPRFKLMAEPSAWKWVAVSVFLILIVLGGIYAAIRLRGRPAGPVAPTTVLIADFNNQTGDPVFNGTLEPIFIQSLEGASFLNSYNRGDARKTAAQLRQGASRLDETLAQLVARRQGIHYVIGGSIALEGGFYHLSVRVVNAATGKTLATPEAEGTNKSGIIRAVGKLAARVRTALGDDTPEALQLAAAETYSATSLEAAQQYGIAAELQLAGKWEDAIRADLRAVELDPDLARGYAALASNYLNVGRAQEAEKYYQMALARIDRMTDREKYRTRGSYYIATRNYPKAIEEFSALVKQYPADSAGHSNLALAYFYGRDMTRSLQEGRRAMELYPANAMQRNNVALYAMYGSDFETAAREARTVMQMSPSFVMAYVALGLSELAQGHSAQAADAYQRASSLGPWGASFASAGLADLALYEGRLTDATGILEKGIAANLANTNPSQAANKLVTLAETQLLRKRNAEAAASLQRAVSLDKGDNLEYAAARVYLAAGQEGQARALAAELEKRLEPDPKAYAKLVEGEARLRRGPARDAIPILEEAKTVSDTWIGHFLLGRAYLEANAFPEAQSEFELCLKRRGEAAALFLDDVPSYHDLPPVHYYLGRAAEGLKSPAAADSYRTFLAIKDKTEADPLVIDARRRLGER